jgi:hypothetical protein
MTVRATPPSVYCEDFALVPRGAHEGKSRVAFTRPVNLLSAASGNGAQAPAQAAAHVLVLNLDGQLYIRDLTGSASLQWNGTTVVEANLNHGDRVRLGKIEYEVFATRCAPVANGKPPPPTAELAPLAGGPMRTVRGPVTVIGASEQAQLRLLAPGALDACAMLLRIGEGYWLWNLDPSVQCRINDEPVVRAALANGSILKIGEDQFRFRIVPQPDAIAPPAKPLVPPAGPATGQAPKAPDDRPIARAGAASTAPAVTPPHATTVEKVRSAPTIPPPTATPQAIPVLVKAPPASLAAIPAPRPTSDALLEDDAELFKQWGPLAFAVAAADRPELQAGGSRSRAAAAAVAQAAATPAPPRGRFVLKLLGVLVLLALLAAGAFFAWKYGRRFLRL